MSLNELGAKGREGRWSQKYISMHNSVHFFCCCYGSEYEVETTAGVSKKLCQLNILLNTYNLSSTAGLDT